MLSILSFIIVIFGSLNWLSIGFFQYDIVAGLFGYQGSIFSRIVYIIIGTCAIYLIYVVIKNKGRITIKKLKKEEQPIIDKIKKEDTETIEKDIETAKRIQSENTQKDNLSSSLENQTNYSQDHSEHISTKKFNDRS